MSCCIPGGYLIMVMIVISYPAWSFSGWGFWRRGMVKSLWLDLVSMGWRPVNHWLHHLMGVLLVIIMPLRGNLVLFIGFIVFNVTQAWGRGQVNSIVCWFRIQLNVFLILALSVNGLLQQPKHLILIGHFSLQPICLCISITFMFWNGQLFHINLDDWVSIGFKHSCLRFRLILCLDVLELN